MKLILSKRLLCDLELLLNGSFAPLNGFLDKKNYESVIHRMELCDGSPWSIPIVLPVTESYRDETIIELYDHDKNHIANLSVHSFYKPNINLECKLVLGTTDINHPYVHVMKSWGDNVYYAGGRVTLVNKIPYYNYLEHRLSPLETIRYFRDNYWNCVIGFQTRNPMHRGHIEITKQSLYDNGPKSKLLLQPIVGVTQENDVEYTARVKCYKHIIKYYDPNTVLLSLLPLSMRMAGPREAMWHALIRKNYGCTHFIVERDHAGPSTKTKDGNSFYGLYDAHKLLESKDLGITIIKSKMLMYVETLKKYLTQESLEIMTVNPFKFKTKSISETEFRRRLSTGEDIPNWFSYPEVVAELRKLYNKGTCIYLIGLSGAGKTTVANALKHYISEFTTNPITILDGDVVRTNLSKGIGFSKEDQSLNVRRIGYVASFIVEHGGIVICANIAPYDEDRKFNQKIISDKGQYLEVFMDTPLDVCEERDPKGLYKKVRAGEIKNFTGIDDPFELPDSDIVLTPDMSVYSMVSTIFEKMNHNFD